MNFDFTINLGQVISATVMVVGGVYALGALMQRITVVEKAIGRMTDILIRQERQDVMLENHADRLDGHEHRIGNLEQESRRG